MQLEASKTINIRGTEYPLITYNTLAEQVFKTNDKAMKVVMIPRGGDDTIKYWSRAQAWFVIIDTILVLDASDNVLEQADVEACTIVKQYKHEVVHLQSIIILRETYTSRYGTAHHKQFTYN